MLYRYLLKPCGWHLSSSLQFALFSWAFMRNLILIHISCKCIVLDLPFYGKWRGGQNGWNALLLMDYTVSGWPWKWLCWYSDYYSSLKRKKKTNLILEKKNHSQVVEVWVGRIRTTDSASVHPSRLESLCSFIRLKLKDLFVSECRNAGANPWMSMKP